MSGGVLEVISPSDDKIVKPDQWRWVGSYHAESGIDISDDFHLMRGVSVVHLYEYTIRSKGSRQPTALIDADDLREARDTVAELIEALRVTQDQLLAYDGHITNPTRADGWSDSDGHQAYMQADAALARANGSDGRKG